MAINPNISLQTTQADIATPINQAAQLDQQNALTSQQTLQAHYANMNEREKMRLRSTVIGASQLKTYLDKGDIEGAHSFLVQRQQALHQRMANGEEIDDQETAYALDKLRNGDIQGLQNDVGAILTAGQAYNMIGGEGLPSSVREWQYYNQLTPEQKQEWLNNKRAGSNIDLGGRVIRLDASGTPAATYDKTLAPADQPENAAAKAEATAAGTKAGELNNPATDSAKNKVSAVLSDIKKNYQDLNAKGAIVSTDKSAASNIAASLGASDTGQYIGSKIGSDEQSIRNKINNQIPALINAIRQATGMSAKAMDSNAELQFYLQQASNPKLDIQANLSALDMLGKLYGTTGEISEVTPQPTSDTSKMVKVTNGKETYMISPADLPAAQAEGFQQVQ